MALTSLSFYVFLGTVTIFHWLLPARFRVPILLIASYIWYSAADFYYLPLLLITTAIDYRLARALSRETDHRKRVVFLCVSVAINLGVLIAFKSSATVIPLGISFYTFHSISYIADVFRRKISASQSILQYALYVAFFPKIVAGPIERYEEFAAQLERLKRWRMDFLFRGCAFIVFGVFLKVVVGDSLAVYVSDVFNDPEKKGILIAVYVYSAQIYADFLGYTLIARGAALLLGFELSRNFLHPYFSSSPREFWRRWHTSLSTWFRDYVYIPLGGNRHHWARNLIITMALAGLWHGLPPQFLVWGLYHAVLLFVGRGISSIASQHLPPSGAVKAVANLLGWFITLQSVCLGWVFFRAADLKEAMEIFALLPHRITTDGPTGGLSYVAFFILPWAFFGALSKWVLRDWAGREYFFAVACGLCFSAILLFGDSSGNPFIYFRF